MRVTFSLPVESPTTGRCSVVGDFNGWEPGRHELTGRRKGMRSATVTVEKGRELRFRYLAEDGLWFSDPDVPDRSGEDTVVRT